MKKPGDREKIDEIWRQLDGIRAAMGKERYVDWPYVRASLISFFMLLILGRLFKRFRKVECSCP